MACKAPDGGFACTASAGPAAAPGNRESAAYTRLVPVCSECGQDNPAEARFCLACGSPLAARPGPAEERKVVTALFCDIVGSTATAEQLDPEDVRARLLPYYRRVREELVRCGGTVEKFIGDAVVALFGAPIAHEDDPERAVRAALAIREALAELNAAESWLDLRVRIGVNTGEALVALGARATEGEALAAGDVLNTAARLQSHAPVNGILVGEATYGATAHAIDYREADQIAAKGKAEPVRAWEAVAARQPPGGRPTSRVSLVGREGELGRLLRAWEDVRASGMPRLEAVLGPPGIGKSRLVAELGAHLDAPGDLHCGRCLSYGEGITYWPVSEIVKAVAGIVRDDTPPVMSSKLGTLLERLRTDRPDELRTIAAALATLVGVPTTPRGTYAVGEISQAELHWGIRRLLELLAAERPVTLVFEDLHWAEPTLLELISFFARGSGPLLLLVTARPELAESERQFLAGARVLELDALDEADSAALVAELLGRNELPERTLGTLLGNAGGNPLFLEETVRMLEAGAATAERDGESLPVPTSLQTLIGSRLDQLPPEEKALAQHASVIGPVFWPGALKHLDASLNGSIPDRLEALERRDLVRARAASSMVGEREYAFKHILIRDVAYGQLPKRLRTELHIRFAEWTSALPGAEDELVEIVAYHLEQACRVGRQIAQTSVPLPVDAAVAALVRAAEKAERREGIREADRFYARALELAGEDVGVGLEPRLRRAGTLAALGELHAARHELLDVAAEAVDADRQDLRCESLAALGNIDWKQGRAADGRDHLTEAVAIAQEIGDRRLEIRAVYELAYLRAWLQGESEEATAELERAFVLAEELGDRTLLIGGLMRLGTLFLNRGELVEAERQLTRAASLAGQLASRRDETRALHFLSQVRYYRGHPEDAEQLALQAHEWFQRTGDSHLQIQNLRALAKYALSRADVELAEERLREALPLALEGGGWLVIEVYRYLTEVLILQGRAEEAQELVAFAARNLAEEEVYARAALLVASGLVATAAAEPSSATASFEEALRILEDQRLLIDLAETRVIFGRALRSFGEETGARTELERARALFKRMGALAPLTEIDRVLEELSEEAGQAP
jgi:class 3 adenylate cyclase/tetratricopeptide (TPR) repeat protein